MILDQPPIDDEIIDKFKPKRNWQYWFNNIFRSVDAHNALVNSHLALNPDFHWSRTKGNTPTVADGEVVEQWNVISNGMTFSATPTYYTNTTFSSQTGSARYINLAITSANSSDFIFKQKIAKGVSSLQNKDMTFSLGIKNNDSNPIDGLFYVGFDLDNNGTDDYTTTSKKFSIKSGMQNLNLQLRCPKIASENYNNQITFALKLNNLINSSNIDLFYIKPEISGYKTPAYVDHTIEKLRIDNR